MLINKRINKPMKMSRKREEVQLNKKNMIKTSKAFKKTKMMRSKTKLNNLSIIAPNLSIK